MQTAARSYFTTQVTTTTQGDLLIMLFDAALKFLSQARVKILERDFAKKGILISKTLDILTELQSTLNPSKGGDMAARLHRLYLYCSTRLLRANRTMDVTLLDEVVRIMTGLRDAFAEANSRVETKPVAVTAGASNARIVPSGPATERRLTSGQAGAASYATIGAPYAGTTAQPVTAETAKPTAAAMPTLEALAGPVATMPASDGPSLETAFAADQIATAGLSVPLAPQAVGLDAVVQFQETETVAPRPITPVRRAMAAYSSRHDAG